jgi:hypothetical protein
MLALHAAPFHTISVRAVVEINQRNVVGFDASVVPLRGQVPPSRSTGE